MRTLPLLFCALFMFNASSQTFDKKNYLEYPVYSGTDLGLNYAPSKSKFKIWSPIAEEVKLKIYKEGQGDNLETEYKLQPSENGTWQIEVEKDLNGKFYTFQVKTDGKWLNETAGTYAKALGVNGIRAAIIDFSKTNPSQWEKDAKPKLASPRDIVLYELHIRDFSIHQSSGTKNKGNYLAFTELNTKNEKGERTCVEHLKELGITHVHLLPTFDFAKIDESKPEIPKYSWGYDPANYNTPEGSYSTSASNPETRIVEFKKMVLALHQAGIRVVMDVVFNHVSDVNSSPFNLEVPGYYFRQNPDGTLSNATQCGNETASERAMYRKYMIESVKHWIQEYHIDGFRFDLMAIHDIETLNQISEEVHKIDSTIYLYGEGWTAGASPLAEHLRAEKTTTYKLNKIAAFSDELRDAIKGPWQVEREKEKGFVSGEKGLEESIKFGISAGVKHPEINYNKVNYSKAPWAKYPYQFISYESCHDNLTLWDKLFIANPNAKRDDLIKMHKLAASIILLSQGTPFLHAGEEFLRSKKGYHNSYQSPDSINQIDWNFKTINKDVFQYYKTLISIRKSQPLLRLATQAEISSQLSFLQFKEEDNIVGFALKGENQANKWKKAIVIFNGNPNALKVTLPAGNWKVIARDGKINKDGLGVLNKTETTIEAISTLILVEN